MVAIFDNYLAQYQRCLFLLLVAERALQASLRAFSKRKPAAISAGELSKKLCHEVITFTKKILPSADECPKNRQRHVKVYSVRAIL